MFRKKKNSLKVLLASLSCVSVTPFGAAHKNMGAINNVQVNNFAPRVGVDQRNLSIVNDKAANISHNNLKDNMLNPALVNNIKNTQKSGEKTNKNNNQTIANAFFLSAGGLGLILAVWSRFGSGFGKKYTIENLKEVYNQIKAKNLELICAKNNPIGYDINKLNTEIEVLKEKKKNIVQLLREDNVQNIDLEVNNLENDKELVSLNDKIWLIDKIENNTGIQVKNTQNDGPTLDDGGNVNKINDVKSMGHYTVYQASVVLPHSNEPRNYFFIIDRNYWKYGVAACYEVKNDEEFGDPIFKREDFDEDDFNEKRQMFNDEKDEQKIINFYNSIYNQYFGAKINNWGDTICCLPLKERLDKQYPVLSIEEFKEKVVSADLKLLLLDGASWNDLNEAAAKEQWEYTSGLQDATIEFTLCCGNAKKKYKMSYGYGYNGKEGNYGYYINFIDQDNGGF